MWEKQVILQASGDYTELDNFLKNNDLKNIFLVCGKSFDSLKISKYFEMLKKDSYFNIVEFREFHSNPEYESVLKGVSLFRNSNSNIIIAVGGGSAIDVAKCIKLYSNMDDTLDYMKQEIYPNDIVLMAVPTTAGTGTEATRYAVIYRDGEKQSVSDYSCIPKVVLFDTSTLDTLPIYQRKSTMLDALCHAMESFWSVNSNIESKEYSKKAIKSILRYNELYLINDNKGNSEMLIAANMAGKAINIAQTTAGHAMCYKLTSLYGIAHGHAAALCVSVLLPYMVQNVDKCIDPRGKKYFENTLKEIAEAFGCVRIEDAITMYKEFFERMKLPLPKPRVEDFDILRTTVNLTRIKNNPILLEISDIDNLYREMLGGLYES